MAELTRLHKMPLINSGLLLNLVSTFRVVWLKGRYGGGKSSLSYMLAYELLRRGRARYLFTNIGCVWRDQPGEIELREGRFVDAVVVMDEAGLFLKYGRDADKFLIGLRKLNIYLIMPSYMPPSNKVRSLNIQRLFNFQVFGLPLWWYRVALNDGDQYEREWFAWWRPSEIWGIYNTESIPVSDGGISRHLSRWVGNVSDGEVENGVEIGDGTSVQEMEEGGGDADLYLEAAEELSANVPLLTNLVRKIRRRR